MVGRELHADAPVIEPHHLPIGSAPVAGERDRMPAITNGSIGMFDDAAYNEFDDAAYTMAAVTATIALYRALVRKGLPRTFPHETVLGRARELVALRAHRLWQARIPDRLPQRH